jgi:hypothetical protein
MRNGWMDDGGSGREGKGRGGEGRGGEGGIRDDDEEK